MNPGSVSSNRPISSSKFTSSVIALPASSVISSSWNPTGYSSSARNSWSLPQPTFSQNEFFPSSFMPLQRAQMIDFGQPQTVGWTSFLPRHSMSSFTNSRPLGRNSLRCPARTDTCPTGSYCYTPTATSR